jgi:hypothetical protein
MGFPSKTQIWEDCCNRSSARYGNPDVRALVFMVQTREHQIWKLSALDNCPDDHSFGSDAQSLDMEIACSESATVRMTGHHRPDVAQIRKEFQQNFGKPIVQLSVQTPYDYLQTAPRFYQARHSVELVAYK